jgi:hypothetical protein
MFSYGDKRLFIDFSTNDLRRNSSLIITKSLFLRYWNVSVQSDSENKGCILSIFFLKNFFFLHHFFTPKTGLSTFIFLPSVSNNLVKSIRKKAERLAQVWKKSFTKSVYLTKQRQ